MERGIQQPGQRQAIIGASQWIPKKQKSNGCTANDAKVGKQKNN